MSTIHDTWIWITCWMEIYIYLGVNVSNTQKAIFTKNLACCLWKRSTVHGAYISSFSWTKIFINFWTNQPSDQKRIIFSKDHTDTLGKIFIIQNAWISNRILNKNLISMLKILKKLISLKKETYSPDISAIHGTWNSNPWTKTCIDLSANVPNYLKKLFQTKIERILRKISTIRDAWISSSVCNENPCCSRSAWISSVRHDGNVNKDHRAGCPCVSVR